MVIFHEHAGATWRGRASSVDLGIESRLRHPHVVRFMTAHSHPAARRAWTKTLKLVFSSPLQIYQSPAKPEKATAKSFQEKGFDSL
jgi:hypothetical protein